MRETEPSLRCGEGGGDGGGDRGGIPKGPVMPRNRRDALCATDGGTEVSLHSGGIEGQRAGAAPAYVQTRTDRYVNCWAIHFILGPSLSAKGILFSTLANFLLPLPPPPHVGLGWADGVRRKQRRASGGRKEKAEADCCWTLPRRAGPESHENWTGRQLCPPSVHLAKGAAVLFCPPPLPLSYPQDRYRC